MEEEFYEKLNNIWQKGLIILIPIDVIILIMTYGSNDCLRWLYLAHLFMLHSHEYEEYVYPGGFREYFNSIRPFKLDPPNKSYPCTPSMIFTVNIGAWLLVIISVICYDALPWLGFSIMFIEIVNFVGHCVFNFMNQINYNPGMLTTIFLLVPWMYFVTICASKILSGGDLILGVLVGIVMAASLPTYGILSRNRFQKLVGKENLII